MLSSLLTIPEAILLGIVEGLTEFLPISSTGHLLIVGELIGFGTGTSQSAADTYSVAIQLGAILAVVVLYRTRILSMMSGAVGRDKNGRAALVSLVVAFVPAAVVGVIGGDAIKDALFGPIPVAIAWAVGGVVLVVWTPRAATGSLHEMTLRSALLIGCAQTVALWPGVSRSLVTLLAGLAVGLSLAAAVEFSFLLGLVTLSAATSLDLARHGGDVVDQFGVASPVLGAVVAFVTAIVAVKWMVGYLGSRSLVIFGWYRLVVAAIAAVLLLTGTL